VRAPLWQDSFQDSFFAPDNRLEGFGNSDFTALTASRPLAASVPSANPALVEPAAESPDDVGGVVVDASRSFSASRH
jgi:hypothetical protein